MRQALIAMAIGACALMTMQDAVPAMPAMKGEIAAAHKWVTTHFTAATPRLPFTFVIDKRQSAAVLQNWTRSYGARRLDDQRTEHALEYADPRTGAAIRCVAIEYHDFPAVEWIVYLRNDGKENGPVMEQIRPLDIEVPSDPADAVTLHYSLGDSNSAETFAPVDRLMEAGGGVATFAPEHGRSSEDHLPFFNLERKRGGTVIAIGWSGQWQADFQRYRDGTTSVSAGQQTTYLCLRPGETIRTPRILLLFWKGGGAERGYNLCRQILLAHYLPQRNGELVLPPICGSVSEVDPDGSYEGPHIRIMPVLAERGIEVFWSDMDPQHWYGDFPQDTGTWVPDPKRYPRGLAPVGEAAHKAGLQYLLWFEPERVFRGTAIEKLHPEWIIFPDREEEVNRLFRLDIPEARKWLTDYIDVQISAARLDWVRWDFNIWSRGYWRSNDAPDRQGMTEIHYIEGLYAMWEDLQRRHPGLIIDLCASGGRRIDLESLRYGLPLHHSDLQCSGPSPAAEQLQNGGLSRWLPLHGCCNFDLEPSYAFRSAMTAGNFLVKAPAPDVADAVKRSVALYHKARPYMLGDFYPLFPHIADEDVWYGYQLHRPDLDAGMAIVFRREKSPDAERGIHLAGMKPTARYEVTFEDAGHTAVISGKAVRELKVAIPGAPGSVIVFYRRVGAEAISSPR